MPVDRGEQCDAMEIDAKHSTVPIGDDFSLTKEMPGSEAQLLAFSELACETHACGQPLFCQNKCKKCYNSSYRRNRHLNLDALEILLRTPACIIMGCGGARYCQGMCHRCYFSEYRRQQREKNTLCFVPDCHRWPSVGLLCRYHHGQKRSGQLAIELPPKERKTSKVARKKQAKKRDREEATEAISDLPPMKKARRPDD